MARDKKVVRLKNRSNFNMGTIIFIILFIYIAFNVVLFLTKDQLAIYEVYEGSIVNSEIITGLVLRDEEVISSSQAGYVTYFQKEGARVAKNAAMYSVDENRDFVDVVASGDVEMKVTDEIHAKMKHDINLFRNTFSDDNFDYVYQFKENAQNTSMNLLNSTLLEESAELYDETGVDYSYNVSASTSSGVISYYMDQYESITPDGVQKEMFDLEQYQRTNLRTTDMITSNSPVYKVIKSDEWSIVLPIDETIYLTLSDKEYITAKIIKDGAKLRMRSKVIQKDAQYYAILTVDKYLTNYLEDRFLEIELDFGATGGLKIPKTASIDKQFYLVPLNYFAAGGNTDIGGLTVGSYNQTGEITYSYETVEIYYKDDNYGYVDANQFENGTLIISPDNQEYNLNQMDTLQGVFSVNNGYAIFRRIDVIYEDESYYIVEKNTPFGLSAYDQIVLDSAVAVEQNIIY